MAVVLTVAAALLLIPLCAQALLGRGIPSITCPLPLPLVIPVFLGGPPLLAIAIPSVAFYIWCRPLFRGEPISARRTVVAFALIAIASVVWFGFGWQHGLEYQGYRYTLTTALISFVFAAVVAFMLILSRRAISLPVSLAINFLLFAWAFTYAFPYLGELP